MLLAMQANWTRELFWQPPLTCFAVLNQHSPPDSTPAAQSGRAVQAAQHASLVAAGADWREPWP